MSNTSEIMPNFVNAAGFADATVLTIASCAASQLPVMLVGPPGVGKTAFLTAVAKKMGYRLATIIGARIDPTDVNGLPARGVLYDADGKEIETTEFLTPSFMAQAIQNPKTMILFDEFSNATPATQASMLNFFTERCTPDGVRLPDEVVLIGAMNPVSEAADGYELTLPTMNRFTFVSWNPSPKEWFQGMLDAWGKANEVSAEEMKWRKLVVSFVRDNPSFLHRPPQPVETTDLYGVDRNSASEMAVLEYAWSSRRSWDNLTRALGHLSAVSDNVAAQDRLIAGTVGAAAAAKFREWLAANDVVDPMDVAKDPSIVNWGKLDIQDATVIIRGLTDLLVTNDDFTEKIGVKCFIGPEFAKMSPEAVKEIDEADDSEKVATEVSLPHAVLNALRYMATTGGRSDMAGAYLHDIIVRITVSKGRKRDEMTSCNEYARAVAPLFVANKKQRKAKA